MSGLLGKVTAHYLWQLNCWLIQIGKTLKLQWNLLDEYIIRFDEALLLHMGSWLDGGIRDDEINNEAIYENERLPALVNPFEEQ